LQPDLSSWQKNGKRKGGRLHRLYSANKSDLLKRGTSAFDWVPDGLKSLILMLRIRNLRFGEMSRKVLGRQA
jgi:hypothetical protein